MPGSDAAVLSPPSVAEVGHVASQDALQMVDSAGGAGAGGTPPPPPPPAAGIDWASVKAAAVEAAAAAPPPPLLSSFDSFDQFSSKRSGDAGEAPLAAAPAAPADEYDPAAPALGLAPMLPADAAGGAGGALRHLFAAPPEASALFGRGVWEGQFLVPGSEAFPASVDALAGAADLAGLLGERDPSVRGRLAADKLRRFLADLRHSRSRAVTAGLLRAPAGAAEGEARARRALAEQYGTRERCGVVDMGPGSGEGYLLPALSPLAADVLEAARAAAPTQASKQGGGGVGWGNSPGPA